MKITRYAIAGAFMLCGASAAFVLKPTVKMAELASRVQLETFVPSEFRDWRIDGSLRSLLVAPELQANLDKIYSQTLSRTYVNAKGERIMLSIAYGADQRGYNQAHRPEFCYPAQGFAIVSNRGSLLQTPFGSIPVRHLETRALTRWEPVTYWMTVAEEAVSGTLDRRLAAIKYGFRGFVPDGLLFRVSSIDRDSPRAFATQAAFVSDLLESLDQEGRRRLSGVNR